MLITAAFGETTHRTYQRASVTIKHAGAFATYWCRQRAGRLNLVRLVFPQLYAQHFPFNYDSRP
jgi:hypothetical protein